MKRVFLASLLFSLNAMAVMETHVYSLSLLKAEGKNKDFCATHGELDFSTSDRLPVQAKFILLNSAGSSDVLTYSLDRGDITLTNKVILTSGGGLNGEGDALTHTLRQTSVTHRDSEGKFTTQTAITENKIAADQIDLPNPELGKVIYTEDSMEIVDLKSMLDLADGGEITIAKSVTITRPFLGFNLGETYNYRCKYFAKRD
jgi:hypothetical protein